MPSTRTRKPRFKGPPADSYARLVTALPPRPLHDRIDYDNAVEMLGRLVGYPLNRDQDDYLEALTVFVEKYESEHEETQVDTSHISGADLLRSLMEANDMTTGDVAALLGVDRSLVSHLLASRRAMTWEHAKALGERFALSPAAFME